jgi:hypothetical protein
MTIVDTGGVDATLARVTLREWVNDGKQDPDGFAAHERRCLADPAPSCLIHLNYIFHVLIYNIGYVVVSPSFKSS